MAAFGDSAKMGVTTTGIGGPLALSGASAGCQTLDAAGIPDGSIVDYRITDGAAWEDGWGQFTSPGTLTRNPIFSSNSNNAISLSGGAALAVVVRAATLQSLNVLSHRTGGGI